MGSTEHSHREHKGQAAVVLAILTGLLLYVVYGAGAEVEAIAKSTFDLHRHELKMIPVGGLTFVLFWFIMSRVLFKPIIALVEEREALTGGAEATAHEQTQQAQSLEQEYEQALQETRIKGMQKKLDAVATARKEVQADLDRAADAALHDIAAGRKHIEQEATNLRTELLKDADSLVDTLVDKVTSDPITHSNRIQ